MTRANATRGVWDDVDRLVDYCRTNQLINLATAFESYEDERKRLHRAIDNLEEQLTSISDKYRELVGSHGRLIGILKRADLDPETLIRTDDIFGEIA